MEKLLKADDVAEVLQVSTRTAYSLMTDMPHLDRPRRVSEYHLRAWIADRTVQPGEKRTARTGARRPQRTESYRIPRRRT